MTGKKADPIESWFLAAEALGEYIGIRFGRIAPESSEPEWQYLRHTDFDGIGAFAELLRREGAELERLPQLKHPSAPSLIPLLKALPKMLLKPRRPLAWRRLAGKTMPSDKDTPPRAVGWHVFDEATTMQIRRACRKSNVTVNSFLLKHLTKVVRPSLGDESAIMPWMVPVNLRGKVAQERDTSNHSSFVGVKICSFETVHDVHRKVYRALNRGEHWANWHAYALGRWLSPGLKARMVVSGHCLPEWYLGGFSNLGDWDPEKKIIRSGCMGSWLFCPPVLRCQLLGAGCVTFHNRLSLTIQVHPELTTDPATPRGWVQNWVKEIDLDLSSVLSGQMPVPTWMAA